MTRRHPYSPLFPYTRSSDLAIGEQNQRAMRANSERFGVFLEILAQGVRPADAHAHLHQHALAASPRPCINWRSEEHTSELQSLTNLVCSLLLEKKKRKPNDH